MTSFEQSISDILEEQYAAFGMVDTLTGAVDDFNIGSVVNFSFDPLSEYNPNSLLFQGSGNTNQFDSDFQFQQSNPLYQDQVPGNTAQTPSDVSFSQDIYKQGDIRLLKNYHLLPTPEVLPDFNLFPFAKAGSNPITQYVQPDQLFVIPKATKEKIPPHQDYKELSLLIASEELKNVVPATRMFSKISRQRILQEGNLRL